LLASICAIGVVGYLIWIYELIVATQSDSKAYYLICVWLFGLTRHTFWTANLEIRLKKDDGQSMFHWITKKNDSALNCQLCKVVFDKSVSTLDAINEDHNLADKSQIYIKYAAWETTKWQSNGSHSCIRNLYSAGDLGSPWKRWQ